jgi:hypothetical protein
MMRAKLKILLSASLKSGVSMAEPAGAIRGCACALACAISPADAAAENPTAINHTQAGPTVRRMAYPSAS